MSRLVSTYLNERVELFDGWYGADRRAEIDAVSRLYNRLIGPVTSLILFRPDVVDPPFYSSAAQHSPLGLLVPDLVVRAGRTRSQTFPGGGKGRAISSSAMGGLGEVAERLLAALHCMAMADRVRYGSYTDLLRQGHHALSPDELPLFSAEQYSSPRFPYEPYRHDTFLGWEEGTDLVTGEPVHVPAQIVHVSYRNRRGEPRIGYPTSGGLAFSADRRRALLHGLYEVVERDAINVRWYCRLPPPRVEVDVGDLLVRDLHPRMGRLCGPATRIQVYLNTLDVPIPAITTLAVEAGRREHALLIGGGAAPGRDRALTQALFELGQCRTALRHARTRHPKTVGPDTAVPDMDDFFDALVYYGHLSNLPKISWFVDASDSVHWTDVPDAVFDTVDDELAAAVTWLRRLGLRAIVFDFGTACWPGAAVIKVFLPGLTQASVPAHPYLGHPRYYTLPAQLGLSDRELRFADLNPYPPPFP